MSVEIHYIMKLLYSECTVSSWSAPLWTTYQSQCHVGQRTVKSRSLATKSENVQLCNILAHNCEKCCLIYKILYSTKKLPLVIKNDSTTTTAYTYSQLFLTDSI